jgi:hypothetical protein
MNTLRAKLFMHNYLKKYEELSCVCVRACVRVQIHLDILIGLLRLGIGQSQGLNLHRRE